MRSERLKLAGDPARFAAELRALVPAPESVAAAVSEILARVRAEGDAAVLDFTRILDTAGAEPKDIEVSGAHLEAALAGLDRHVRRGLELAIDNVRRVAEAGIEPDREVDFGTHRVLVRSEAVSRAAVYVPGGRAPYPSTAVMGIVPALVAGVREVCVCSPPGPDGELDGTVLAACGLAGATSVYRMGGAQAIAALAYGTESVSPVDVIVGPGNLYVQEAKLKVSRRVGIDAFAGPSDLVVIADSAAHLAALDLLAQAEHGTGTIVIGISPSPAVLDELGARLDAGPDTGAVARLVEVDNHRQALALARAFAPEHLELIGPEAEALAPEATRAGCVFVGANAGTAFGDYVAGSNHILPTGGAARFAAALSAATFRRRFTEVRIADPDGLAQAAAPVARAEGFELHARSMEARLRQNGRNG